MVSFCGESGGVSYVPHFRAEDMVHIYSGLMRARRGGWGIREVCQWRVGGGLIRVAFQRVGIKSLAKEVCSKCR